MVPKTLLRRADGRGIEFLSAHEVIQVFSLVAVGKDGAHNGA